jgi:aminoglycoside phosphotransferase family enzyme
MILSIIYKISDKFLIVVDNSEKIEDVSKMPSYIQDDYLKVTSRPLIEEDIDNLIKVLNRYQGSSVFQEHEHNHLQRLIDYLDVVKTPHSEAFEMPKLLNDFKQFSY